MPWSVSKSSKCPANKPWAVVKTTDGSLVACHPSKAAAQKQVAALYANEPGAKHSMSETAPPRENIVRAVFPGVEFRDNGDGRPVLAGNFARYNVWNEIDSIFEGRFLERVAHGAYKKTFKDNRDKMRLLLNHGKDPELGDKPLGKIDVLREDEVGPYYEASLFDGIPPLVMDGLRASQYGQSYRFRVVREEIDDDPGVSDHNPLGLPERTIKEAQVMEFGPVTFPADAGATAGVRSIGDEFLVGELTGDPQRLREWLYRTVEVEASEAETTDEERDLAPDEESGREEPSDEEEAAPPTDRADQLVTRADGRRRMRPLPGQLAGGRHAPLYGQLGRKETS